VTTRLTRSATPRLAVIIHGHVAGHVFAAANRRLVFRYSEAWQATAGAIPLSVSMPLAAVEHGHRAISAWLWGVLPDNPVVIERWARAFGTPRHDVVQLLLRVGEDCAGAVQLVAPDRVGDLLGAPTAAEERSQIEWLTVREVESLLTGLRQDPAAGRTRAGSGQFSLAGAQPKTALYESPRRRWGIPRGRVPSNRILKPPVLDLADLAWNEHACLKLARALGLAASSSRVQRFGREITIVVERFDRLRMQGVLRRIHQEDACQALAVMPTRKYESDGGPGAVDVTTLLSRYSSAPDVDAARFLDAMMFNWLIGGTDAHAKNFALLHGTPGEVRLAPLYDVISALPYPSLGGTPRSLAMAIHGERAIDRIDSSHWRGLARSVGFEPSLVLDRLVDLSARLPDAVDRVIADHDADPAAGAIVARLLNPVVAHAQRCRLRLR